MSRIERAQRIGQLREQLSAITEEIARLEREDEGYVAYVGRAQAARQAPLPYLEFARYAVAFEQYEGQWVQAGRPANWPHLELLTRLRQVLLVPAPAAAAGGAQAPRLAAPTDPRAAAGRRAAPGPGAAGKLAAGSAQPPTQRPPAAASGKPGQPTPGTRPAAAARVSHENLAEQHSPILNEVVELAKRAEEELRLAQFPAGLASVDRAIYLLERVYHAPPALTNRIIKLLDDAGRGSALSDSDRQRWEQLKSRADALLAENAA